MINGVIITPLKQILDERGKIMHMLRNDSEVFRDFGEIYFSCVYPGAIKGWLGERGELLEYFLGPDNYYLVTVPPMVWNGFKGVGTEIAIVANCASIPHDPKEIERRDPFDPSIPYNWEIKHR